MQRDAIVQLNTSGMRPHDLPKLRGLRMDFDEDAAFFSVPGGWNVSGTVTGLHEKPVHGLKRGNLSFVVPGIDAPVG